MLIQFSDRKWLKPTFLYSTGVPFKALVWLVGLGFIRVELGLIWRICVYVIVIAQVPGIYGSKQTESEGIAQGQGLFTTAINPWPPVL